MSNIYEARRLLTEKDLLNLQSKLDDKVELDSPFDGVNEVIVAKDASSVMGSRVYLSDLATKSFVNQTVSSIQGSTVEANPALDGTETVLTGITIDGEAYSIPSGGAGDGASVEANPTDAATDFLTKLKVAGVTYALPSGGSGDDTSEPIIVQFAETEDGIYFTLTEDELTRITNNLGTVVNLDLDGAYLPLAPAYIKFSMSTRQMQLILCAEIVELNVWYKFEQTEESPLVFVLNMEDTSSPYGGGTSEGTGAPYVLHDYTATE